MLGRTTLAVVMIAMMLGTVNCAAQPPEGKQRGKRNATETARKRERAKGEMARGVDSERLVARLIEEFDKDGDQKLDVAELTALMVSMRERRTVGAKGRTDQSSDKGNSDAARKRDAGLKGTGQQTGGGKRKGKLRGEAEPEAVGGENPIRPGRDASGDN